MTDEALTAEQLLADHLIAQQMSPRNCALADASAIMALIASAQGKDGGGQPECTGDPNTCRVAFCGWPNKCP